MAESEQDNPLNLLSCKVDLSRGRVLRPGKTKSLSALEVGVLRVLRSRPGEVVGRDELLRDVWGYDQAVLTRSVDNTISRLRNKIERDASHPDHVITVHGEGYRFVPLSDGPTAPPLPHAANTRDPLPTPGTAFIGREGAINDLRHSFEEGARLITLLGPGGVGKTRLAVQWARAHLEGFDRVVFCDLAGARSEANVIRGVARALGVPLEERGDGGMAQVGRALAAQGRLLLIADNLEQVVSGAQTPVAAWLKACPELRILATSRAPLGIVGEHRHKLSPFGEADAVDLFISRALAVRSNRHLPPREGDAVLALVKRLDGLPLAIELAAARTSSLEPSAMLARLDDRLTILGRRSSGPDRQATMEAAIAWSWELLTEAERDLLCQLSLFQNGADLEAVEGVYAAAEGAPPAVLVLTALVDHSLVYVREEGLGARYHMFEVVRSFAASQLERRAKAHEARSRHARWYAIHTKKWGEGLEGPHPEAASSRMRSEAPNIDRATLWALEHDASQATQLILAARWLALTQGPINTWIGRATQALGTVDPQSTEAARLRLMLGELRHLHGDMPGAQTDLSEALAVGRALGEAQLEAEALIRLGSLDFFLGQIDEAMRRLLQGAALAKAHGLPRLEGMARDRMGTFIHVLGRPAEARAELARAQRAYQRAGARALAAQARANLALMDLELGRTERAAERLEAAITLNQQMGNRRNEALLRINLAEVSQESGDGHGARQQLVEALGVARAFGLTRSEALALTALAVVDARQGDLEPAREAILEAQAILSSLGEPLFEGLAWAYLGAIDALDDGIEEAQEAFEEARTLLEGTGAQARMAVLDVLEGLVDVAQGKAQSGKASEACFSRATQRVEAVSLPKGNQPPLTDRSTQVRSAVILLNTALSKVLNH